MPKNETVVKVFVASPRKLSAERDQLSDVIEWINSSLSERTGVRLAILRYEQTVAPDIGEDAQAVVNSQIPNDYDVFVGILWDTIGEKTNRAESGTIEEYELAKKRHENDPLSVRIMLYFKDETPTSLQEIDPQQLQKVNDFRKRVSSEGVFYDTFTTTEKFREKIKRHLMKIVLEWRDKRAESGNGSVPSVHTGGQIETADDSNDLGIIELEEILEEEVEALKNVIENMERSIRDVGENMSEREKSIKSLSAGEGASGSNRSVTEVRSDIKRITKDTSNDMDQFVRRMDDDVPKFKIHHDKLLNTLVRAIPIYEELNQDITKTRRNLVVLLEAHQSMLESMKTFHKSIVGIPRLTAVLNRSKSRMGKSVQEFINIAVAGISVLENLISLVPDDK